MADTAATNSADTATVADADAATMVTTDEAARLAGVSARTVRRWIQRGFLPAVEAQGGQLVSPADLPAARRAAGRGHGHDRGHRAPDADTVTDTGAVAVSPAARAQLEAVRDEWLRPFVDQVADLSRQLGRVEAERDGLRAEVERLRSAQDAPTAAPEGPGATGAASPPFHPSGAAWRQRTSRAVDVDAAGEPAPWWRFWGRRR